MKLKKNFLQLIQAGFSGIWLQSNEHSEALKELLIAVEDSRIDYMYWDPLRGLRTKDDYIKELSIIDSNTNKDAKSPKPLPDIDRDTLNPLIAIERFKLAKRNEGARRIVLIMRNVEYMIADQSGRVVSPTLLHSIQTAIEQGESQGRHIVIMGYPDSKIPTPLEKMVAVVEFDLPDPDELYTILQDVAASTPNVVPPRDTQECQLLLDASTGLSRVEAAGAYSLSLVQSKNAKIDPHALWSMKEQMIRKTGLLELLKPTHGFEMLGGLNNLKDFCLRIFNSKNRSDKVQPKGIMCLGLPGTGKSAFAQCLGWEVGLPTVRLDIGALMGGIVGMTEANTRRALKQIDAMAPCILFADEVEKALAGAGGGALDSGVSDRLFGTLLTWLNDHKTRVFFIGTCNDVSRLSKASQGAFARAERFDAMFFMDIPDENQRAAIWDIYKKHFDISAEQMQQPVDDDKWTGAEIRSCCRLARLLDCTLAEAAQQVVPVSRTNTEQIAALKQWADGRCLSADFKGIYRINGPVVEAAATTLQRRPRRQVTT